MKFLHIIIKVILIITFLSAGVLKIFTPYSEMLENPNLQWAEGYTSAQIIAISLVEIFCALVLLFSFFKKSQLWLSLVASLFLSFDMIGAISTHSTRDEPYTLNIVLLLLSLLLSVSLFIKMNKS